MKIKLTTDQLDNVRTGAGTVWINFLQNSGMDETQRVYDTDTDWVTEVELTHEQIAEIQGERTKELEAENKTAYEFNQNLIKERNKLKEKIIGLMATKKSVEVTADEAEELEKHKAEYLGTSHGNVYTYLADLLEGSYGFAASTINRLAEAYINGYTVKEKKYVIPLNDWPADEADFFNKDDDNTVTRVASAFNGDQTYPDNVIFTKSEIPERYRTDEFMVEVSDE